MTRTRKLTSRAAIEAWVKYRNGQPAFATLRDSIGRSRQRLTLAFRGRPLPPPGLTQQTNISPCSWNAWFAELDRQGLALEVADTDEDDIQPSDINFISRSLNPH